MCSSSLEGVVFPSFDVKVVAGVSKCGWSCFCSEVSFFSCVICEDLNWLYDFSLSIVFSRKARKLSNNALELFGIFNCNGLKNLERKTINANVTF